jgi:hypothetical protein
MDHDRFDTVTRALAAGASRRGLLTRLTMGVLAALLLARGSHDVEAKPCPPCRKKKKGRCKGRKPNGTPCENGRGVCQSGSCGCAGGSVCARNEVCQGGICFPKGTCPQGAQACVPETGTKCGLDCFCVQSAEGNTVCIESAGLCGAIPVGCDSKETCSSCQTSADCASGQACIDISGCCEGQNTADPLPAGTKVCVDPCSEPDA